MLAIETLPLFLLLDGVPGVIAPLVLPPPGVAGVRPPLDVREELVPPTLLEECPPLEFEPRTNRPLEGVPGVLGVLAGVPGSRPPPGVPGVVLPPLVLTPCSILIYNYKTTKYGIVHSFNDSMLRSAERTVLAH